jgi:23S rRNA (cytidine2498-2'-O)-methyltransferase
MDVLRKNYDIHAARQLHHNRNELTVVAHAR